MTERNPFLNVIRWSIIFSAFFFGLLSIIGSSSDDDENASDSGTSVTLKHESFDFSAGVVPTDYNDADGETIGWVPSPSDYPSGVAWGDGVWWRSSQNTNTENYSKDMGEVSLDSLSTVPTAWDGGDGETLMYLQVNHVYVVKCNDGYAAFLVESIDTETWDVGATYIYTSGNSF